MGSCMIDKASSLAEKENSYDCRSYPILTNSFVLEYIRVQSTVQVVT